MKIVKTFAVLFFVVLAFGGGYVLRAMKPGRNAPPARSVLYYVDPGQDGLPVAEARDLLGDRMTLCGGINALALQGDRERIRADVRAACEVLGPTHRFVLQPVDAVFPDTPWEGMEALIRAWEECNHV